ncbi:hypothetical protein [Levilactobacillus acidifarinae]|uniref:Uncharacterized protein n=1 Tax=Levilactobacillus acidifarinae DSM 19394 = JCM 15949 TaxID=1423715 RepID=A0A0R1LEH1_9LACO|nr:hypothetical protein [Levilactobacillus acidifarinae]KRK93957.1 hypothetical protein FD25_GL001286 [Levilactobacillus acidifarinae DSM 19394]GEO68845.1 hypothetical protein LAC03_07550 [Levilactobacillus acidifarinae]
MAKRHHAYVSPFAALMGAHRFEFATQLAQQTGLDPSQILFAYLQITASVAGMALSGETARQRTIDQQFQQFLTDAQAAD